MIESDPISGIRYSKWVAIISILGSSGKGVDVDCKSKY